MTCFQVDEEASFESPFILCSACSAFKNDRLISNIKNDQSTSKIIYKWTLYWKKRPLGNKKAKPNPSFNALLEKVAHPPNKGGELQQWSSRKITPNTNT